MANTELVIRKVAHHVRERSERSVGHIYRCDPPMALYNWEGADVQQVGVTEYVWVSAVTAYSGPETLIFACTPDGEVTDWLQLDGSYRGGLDHERALNQAGYEVD